MYYLLNKRVLIGLVLAFGFGCAGSPKVSEKENKMGTREEASALFSEAMDYVREHGKKEAFAAFNDKDGRFVSGDLYVFCLDFDKNWKVMGANPSLVGKNAARMRDSKGKDFVSELIEIAKTKGKGRSNYSYENPLTSQEELKTSFIERVSENEFCGMGYYNR